MRWKKLSSDTLDLNVVVIADEGDVFGLVSGPPVKSGGWRHNVKFTSPPPPCSTAGRRLAAAWLRPRLDRDNTERLPSGRSSLAAVACGHQENNDRCSDGCSQCCLLMRPRLTYQSRRWLNGGRGRLQNAEWTGSAQFDLCFISMATGRQPSDRILKEQLEIKTQLLQKSTVAPTRRHTGDA